MNLNKITTWALGSGIGLSIMMVAPAFASAATLSVSPASGSHASGTTFEVKILLNTTGTTTSGTDAYIRYDPTALQVVDASPGTEGTQILAGSLYSQTSYNSVDNSIGKISFSGSKSGGSPGYSGSGTLATITFQAVKEVSGSAVTFDFTQGSTTDSNVIDQSSSDDVLTAVTNGSYTITAAAASSDGSSTDTSGTGAGTGTSGTGSSGSGSSGSGSGSTGGTGSGDGSADGTSNTTGNGGSSSVAGTGIDLNIYFFATIISLLGAGYFLTRKSAKK